MSEYDQKPVLENTDTGETLTLYYVDFNRVQEDHTVVHHPAGRDGDIEQQMGYGSRQWTGTLNITATMDSNGISGYKEKLLKMAKTDHPLKVTLDDGSTTEVTLRVPDLNKGEGNAPNKIQVSGVTISEIDQPVNSL